MFFNSQSKPEKQHLIDAFTFELGKVDKVCIRERMLGLLTQADKNLVAEVAGGLGLSMEGTVKNTIKTRKVAFLVADGKKNIATLRTEPDSVHFVNEAYKHCKEIATGTDSAAFLSETYVKEIELKNLNMQESGIITDGNADMFIKCIASHRFWNREKSRKVPA